MTDDNGTSWNWNDEGDYVVYYDKHGYMIYFDKHSKGQLDNYKTILVPGVIEKTSIVDDTEKSVIDYIYEMDKNIIMDADYNVYSIIQDKAYDMAEQVLTDALASGEYTLLTRDRCDAVEEIVSLIDFESLYEIIDEILSMPLTFEEKLAEVGMSIRDFI